jgi:hypothetical protein
LTYLTSDILNCYKHIRMILIGGERNKLLLFARFTQLPATPSTSNPNKPQLPSQPHRNSFDPAGWDVVAWWITGGKKGGGTKGVHFKFWICAEEMPDDIYRNYP